jgi:glycosyltransferase involved in cell wall biosynthesis
MDSAYVNVLMPTYNHKAYIAEAIESVLKQKTAFSFELVIGEDCSTDGTKEIVLKYQEKNPQIIRLITPDSNVGSRANNRRMLEYCQGRYIAFCDGDDYWHHPGKLQKQVDFLDSHPNYGLVHTDFDKLKVDKGKLISNFQSQSKKRIPEGCVYEELLQGTFIATCTVCARRELVDGWQKDAEFSNMRFVHGDYSKWLFVAWHSKIGYLPVSTATKRELRNSMSHSDNLQKRYDYYMNLHEIKKTYMARFPCSVQTENRVKLIFHKQKLRFAYITKNLQSAKESYLFLSHKSFPSLKNTFYFIGSFVKSLKWRRRKIIIRK